jgi:hypothetical protein
MALADDDVRFRFERELVFRTLRGEPLHLQARQLQVAAQVTLQADASLADWQRLLAAGCFQLDDVAQPPGLAPDRPVRLLLQLRSRVAADFDNADVLLAALLGEDDPQLRQTEAWTAIEATQRLQVPGVEGGWAEIGWRRDT